MKIKLSKYTLSIFITTISFAAFANNIDLDESRGLYTDLNVGEGNYYQQATYKIRGPGIFTWVENGKIHFTEKMPACIIVLAKALDNKQLEKFTNEIQVTTQNTRELPLLSYKGTLTFVDKHPFYSSFGETIYIIKTKNNLTFGQLLRYVGGTNDSNVYIYFDRGCADLSTRPYLPDQANIKIKTDLERFKK